jgi:SSS family solute:Na+ symporter
MTATIRLGGIDYFLLLVYFGVVLGIGFALRRSTTSSREFFMAGRSIPAWITGLAFISANLGAQEVMGMGASGAKYGMMTSHFYWVGAIPAMVFIGIFMMPFYYGSRARSVPEYLKLRFDEKTRGLNALSFATMTVFSSGVSMYAMGELMQELLGWNFTFSVVVSGAVVLAYIGLGGLTSAIYNEVLQFFLIVFGLAPLVFIGLGHVGGWSGMMDRLAEASVHAGFQPGAWGQSWRHLGSAADNPMGVEWFGMVMGLGFVLSFGYWCTDFLVVQRAMAADSMSAARRTPLIAAVPKMFFPFLVIVPGMIAMALHTKSGFFPLKADGSLNYDRTIPLLMKDFLPNGLLGLGMTALFASFMSGMAGNVTAFNTVWTYDIYQSYLRPGRPDEHYLWMGRVSTVAGIAISIAAAYVARQFNNIMDMLQLVFAFVNAPLFATFLLGMFWKRATGHGAFFGLLAGTAAAALHHAVTLPFGSVPGVKGGYLAMVHRYPSEMAQNFWTAIFSFTSCFLVTVAVSLATRRQKTDAELEGLVYALTPRPREEVPLARQPAVLAAIVLVMTVALNIIFF